MDYNLTPETEAIFRKAQIGAVIFDLDGTMIDNNEYHLKTWREYIKHLGLEISEDNYNKYINGRTNRDAIEYIYDRKMDDLEAMKYSLEKESLYRKMYAPFITPVPGLPELLAILKERRIKMGIATSGIQVNIDFMFDNIPIRDYFNTVVNSSHIKKGKPDPEIYLLAASQLNVAPANCLVFEDAAVGVRSAKAAGMTVIALTTTQPVQDLAAADLVIGDFRDLLT